MFLVHLPCPRVLERGELGHHLGHRRLGYLSLLSVTGELSLRGKRLEAAPSAESALVSEHDELDTVAGAEFGDEPRDVGLDRSLTEEQLVDLKTAGRGVRLTTYLFIQIKANLVAWLLW